MIASLALLPMLLALRSAPPLSAEEQAKCAAAQAAHPVSDAMRARKLVSSEPPSMRGDFHEACIVLTYRVAADGNVSDVHVEYASSPDWGLIAQRTVGKWRYEPGAADAGTTSIVVRLSRD
ncbi:MAG TPA: hypothetical protein VFL14_06645 [Xanthomonadales bacterium]|nr:hypothetical protein [Xanthomonadales bacterium]